MDSNTMHETYQHAINNHKQLLLMIDWYLVNNMPDQAAAASTRAQAWLLKAEGCRIKAEINTVWQGINKTWNNRKSV